MAYASSSEAYDKRGNLKKGLVMQEDGTISTQSQSEDDEQDRKETYLWEKEKHARNNAHAWGANTLNKMGLGKVAEMDAPAWFGPVEDFFVGSGLFGKEGMIIGTERDSINEMKYNGYQTKNFHTCPSALNVFSKIEKLGLRGKERELITLSMEMVDAMLGVEVVVKMYGGDKEDLYLMMMLNNKVFYILGKLEDMTDMNFLNGFTFMADHIDTAASIIYGTDKSQGMDENMGYNGGNEMNGKGVKILKLRVKK